MKIWVFLDSPPPLSHKHSFLDQRFFLAVLLQLGVCLLHSLHCCSNNGWSCHVLLCIGKIRLQRWWLSVTLASGSSAIKCKLIVIDCFLLIRAGFCKLDGRDSHCGCIFGAKRRKIGISFLVLLLRVLRYMNLFLRKLCVCRLKAAGYPWADPPSVCLSFARLSSFSWTKGRIGII